MTKCEIPLDKQCDWCGAPKEVVTLTGLELCKPHDESREKPQYEAIGGRQ